MFNFDSDPFCRILDEFINMIDVIKKPETKKIICGVKNDYLQNRNHREKRSYMCEARKDGIFLVFE
jgi:hypothetical protein